MLKKQQLPVVLTELLVASMTAAAELSGEKKILFPEIAAIAAGTVILTGAALLLGRRSGATEDQAVLLATESFNYLKPVFLKEKVYINYSVPLFYGENYQRVTFVTGIKRTHTSCFHKLLYLPEIKLHAYRKSDHLIP